MAGTGWDMVAEARREAADLIEGLSPEQQGGTTLCPAWTPHGVLAHLVTFVDLPLPKFMWQIAKARGDFDAASIRMAADQARRSVPELAASLRERAAKPSPIPSFPAEMTLTDVAIHTQDVRRGLGLDGRPGDDVLRTALQFATTNKRAKAFIDQDRLQGLRLVATDVDWSHGSGDEIRGPAEALLLAIAGRPTHDELSGAVDRIR